jgi:hypothetical protein
MKIFLISDTQVREVFEYREGFLYWKLSPVAWIKVGDKVGTKRKDGYWETQYQNVRYLVHRLIFLYHHGYLPSLIDHIDRNPSNNCIENLTESSKSKNSYNSKLYSNNKSGIRGVSWSKTNKKWAARFKKGNKYLFLGYFGDIEEAKKIRNYYEKGGV